MRASRAAPRAERHRPHAVIVVENMTVPPDRRVWQQALALRADGWRVTVVTPRIGSWCAPRERIEGVDIRRHPLPVQARSIATYAAEYAAALAGEAAELLKIGLRDIDVVQICNPPDFLFLPALLAKQAGARVVFDHHDLTPELLVEKMRGRAGGPLLGLARWAERRTFATADAVISTNASFRDHAIRAGAKRPEDVHVVYSAPDLQRLPIAAPNPALKKGADVLLLWVGVMGSQDGLDILVDAAAALKAMPGGARFHLLVAGDGPERATAEARARSLSLERDITFAGFLTGERLAQAFATADIGVGSDPKTPFNDRLAMNKVMEYMAYGLPIAMFDLDESRRIAGDAALYAGPSDPKLLAARLSVLVESPALRASKGATGRRRLETDYAWAHQKEVYLDVYRSLLSGR